MSNSRKSFSNVNFEGKLFWNETYDDRRKQIYTTTNFFTIRIMKLGGLSKNTYNRFDSAPSYWIFPAKVEKIYDDWHLHWKVTVVILIFVWKIATSCFHECRCWWWWNWIFLLDIEWKLRHWNAIQTRLVVTFF